MPGLSLNNWKGGTDLAELENSTGRAGLKKKTGLCIWIYLIPSALVPRGHIEVHSWF